MGLALFAACKPDPPPLPAPAPRTASPEVAGGPVFGPIAAGREYPVAQADLWDLVRTALDAAPALEHGPDVGLTCLLVPHGPLDKVADVLAAGWKALGPTPPRRVVLLLATHERKPGWVAALDAERWAFPLGSVTLDLEGARRLVEANDFIRFDRGAFAAEPVAEVQLALLRPLAPGAHLLPLLMGEQDAEMTRRLAKALLRTQAFGADTLLVVSSGLGPTPLAEGGEEARAALLARLQAGDPDALRRAASAGEVAPCALGPLTIALELARAFRAGEPKVLARRRGLAALAWLDARDRPNTATPARPPPPPDLDWSPALRADLLEVATKTVVSHVAFAVEPEFRINEGRLLEPHAAAVTVRRGAVVYGEGEWLAQGLPVWRSLVKAASAAVASPRQGQPPLLREDLAQLRIEATLLGRPEPLDNPLNVQAGREGLVLERGATRVVLLPQLAAELGWDPLTLARQACRRAGLPVECRWDRAVVWKRFGVLAVHTPEPRHPVPAEPRSGHTSP